MPSPLTETITAHGHHHVTAEHTSTIEVTTDDFLTPAGDCIVGIEADRAPADFAPAFVRRAQDADTEIVLTLTVDGMTERIVGRGDPGLTFASERSLVGRTSTYIDDRTVFVAADRAAGDLPASMVSALADGASLTAELVAHPH